MKRPVNRPMRVINFELLNRELCKVFEIRRTETLIKHDPIRPLNILLLKNVYFNDVLKIFYV